jgi:3-oxoacyl-(acyl-carrier-protein) synthase/thioesterase domain-containing protein/aryl carrier-like protein
MALARALETHVGKVPRTLFLELPTLAALADHLADHHAFPAKTSAPPPPPALADDPARTPPVPGDSPRSPAASPTPPVPGDSPQPATAPPPPDLTTTPHAPGAAPRTELPLPTISDDRVAIIGMAGRFPGAPDLETYADDLREGRSRITDLPAARRDDPGGPPRLGGWLADVDRFDHALFQIPHLEATAMDPAERLFLEIAWETLEHAGYPRSRRAASQRRSGLGTGVFVGCMYRQYAHLARDPETRGLLSNGSYWAIANRVSWFFDLQGPSLALDNACAAGLSAVHQACLVLRAGECAMALAGAVNLSLHPHKHKGLALAGLLSGSPTPRLFGEGDGFLPGEGVAAVLLKPLARAVADGDRVLAVVRASRLGHGGKTAGLSVPATLAQADLVAGTLARAGLGPRDLDYLELAANGSAIGDAVELRALARALAGAPPGSIPVGSTKASLGHLEAASGLAQLIKVVLQLRRRELFPSLPTTHPPVRLPDGTPLRLVPALVAWPARRAGIHAFGAGGSEAFLLLESHAPPDPLPATAAPAPKDSPAAGFIAPLAPPAPKDSPHLFLFSAATPDRLRAWIARLADHLARHAPTPADLAYTLQIARERLPHRLAVVADDLRELRDLLALWQSGATDPRLCTGETDAADLLLDGPEGEAFLRVALANRRLDKLARVWVRGVEADGSALHPGRPRLVDLPPYPFTPTVCWLREPPPPAQTPPSLAATSHASVQATIRDLLADLLRCDPAALDPHRDLHDLGLTSMLATSLVLGLRDRLRVDLPLAALRDAPTIEALARRLATTTPPITDPLPPELLRLQRGEGALPSFWVHGAPGFAEVFAGLPALLGPDRSIYAFRARGLDGARPPFHDIGAMTDHYVDALLHARPTGPTLLGGYSLGGLIAHAMAHRLRDRGVAVAALVLFDTYPVGDDDPADADADADTDADTKKSGPKGREDEWKRMIADMFLNSGHLPGTALDGVPEALHASRLAALLADRPTILPADRLYPALCGAFAVSAHHREALRRYRPPRLVGVPALYVRAARGLDGRPDRPEDRARRTDFWQQRIAEVVRIVDLDADHHGLLASDHHPALRAALASVLPGAACP